MLNQYLKQKVLKNSLIIRGDVMNILEVENLSTERYEKFEFDKIDKCSIPVGILICYLFGTCKKTKFIHFSSTSESEEIGSGFNIVTIEPEDKDKFFCDIKALKLLFDVKDLEDWEMDIEYRKEEFKRTGEFGYSVYHFTIVGNANSAKFGMFFPYSVKKEHIDLLIDVEKDCKILSQRIGK